MEKDRQSIFPRERTVYYFFLSLGRSWKIRQNSLKCLAHSNGCLLKTAGSEWVNSLQNFAILCISDLYSIRLIEGVYNRGRMQDIWPLFQTLTFEAPQKCWRFRFELQRRQAHQITDRTLIHRICNLYLKWLISVDSGSKNITALLEI